MVIAAARRPTRPRLADKGNKPVPQQSFDFLSARSFYFHSCKRLSILSPAATLLPSPSCTRYTERALTNTGARSTPGKAACTEYLSSLRLVSDQIVYRLTCFFAYIRSKTHTPPSFNNLKIHSPIPPITIDSMKNPENDFLAYELS